MIHCNNDNCIFFNVTSAGSDTVKEVRELKIFCYKSPESQVKKEENKIIFHLFLES